MRRSLEFLQWVLPTQQVLEILRNSRSYALANCLCRSKHQRCDNPLEVCFYINDVADQKSRARRGPPRRPAGGGGGPEAGQPEHGLVHLTIYNPEQHVYALCSCCECCCHDIGFMKQLGRPDLVAHSDYVAVVDTEACVQCGECTLSGVFLAPRAGNRERWCFYQDKCYGCGLCVSTCASNAVQMVLRSSQP